MHSEFYSVKEKTSQTSGERVKGPGTLILVSQNDERWR